MEKDGGVGAAGRRRGEARRGGERRGVAGEGRRGMGEKIRRWRWEAG